MIDAAAISRARATPIESVVAHLKLKGRGAERCGPCPACGGTDRFSINIRKQLFNCRGCNAAGDVIELVRLLDGCSFAEAVEHLAGGVKQRQRTAPPPPNKRKIDDQEYRRQQASKAAWLWEHRQPFTAGHITIAEHYLRVGRGYGGPLPPTLAFLPPRREDHHPALIAAFGLWASSSLACLPSPGMSPPST